MANDYMSIVLVSDYLARNSLPGCDCRFRARHWSQQSNI